MVLIQDKMTPGGLHQVKFIIGGMAQVISGTTTLVMGK
jgi:hypothetical protein